MMSVSQDLVALMQSSVMHKNCSGIKGPLRPDPEFRCARCLGTAQAIDER